MSAKRKKRKINLQNVYREMLDKQVAVKKDRQLKQRMEELEREKYMINDSIVSQSQDRQHMTIDCFPHEWNDP